MKNNLPIKAAIAIISLVALTACTQPVTAHRILEDAGYTNIQMQGYGFFQCSEDDTFADKFTATGPTGKSTSGVVCAGLLFKGATIRLD